MIRQIVRSLAARAFPGLVYPVEEPECRRVKTPLPSKGRTGRGAEAPPYHGRPRLQLLWNRSSMLLLIAIAFISGWLSAQVPKPAATTPELVFSTYLGGTTPCKGCSDAHTYAQNAASDTEGDTYVTGATRASNLRVLNAWQPNPANNSQKSAFVAKYDPAGKLLWLTYLGGNGQSMGTGIAVMPDGGVAVGGITTSSGSEPFPTKYAFQGKNKGQTDYFVTVFDANGNLLYSTYLGGSGNEGPGFSDDNSNGNNVAADAHGLVYLAGNTSRISATGATDFPVTANALQSLVKGSTDAFLCILDPAKSGKDSLIYCSLQGGSGDEKGHSIAVNAKGDLIAVAGYTNSSDFPTTSNGYRSHPAPKGFTSNGFLTQFRSSKPGDRSSVYTARYSTYLGADSKEARDDVYGITLDSSGLILATGRTESPDFPMTAWTIPSIFNSAPYLKPRDSGDEPFLVKIDPSLKEKASLVYASFLGGGSPAGQATGGWGTFCTSIGVDSKGKAYVAGETYAPGILYAPIAIRMAPTKFPYTSDALINAFQGEIDAVLMQVSSDGTRLGYSTFLGGSGNDRTYGLAVDPAGNVVLTGLTSSSDFPVKNATQNWPGIAGEQNAFVTKFSFSTK